MDNTLERIHEIFSDFSTRLECQLEKLTAMQEEYASRGKDGLSKVAFPDEHTEMGTKVRYKDTREADWERGHEFYCMTPPSDPIYESYPFQVIVDSMEVQYAFQCELEVNHG